MATTRICYKNAQGQVVCYDSGSAAMQLTSAGSSASSGTPSAGPAAAGSPPPKANAMAQILQVLADAINASGTRQMHDHPEFISIEYYAD